MEVPSDTMSISYTNTVISGTSGISTLPNNGTKISMTK